MANPDSAPTPAPRPSEGPDGTAIGVSNRDLWLIRQALIEYLASLSHTEGELVDEVKVLLQKLPTVDHAGAPGNQVFPHSSRLTL